MTHQEIRKQINILNRERMHKQKELMETYDKEIYYPARAELVQACERLGHIKGYYHDNGLGWQWWYCSVCGSSFDKQKV